MPTRLQVWFRQFRPSSSALMLELQLEVVTLECKLCFRFFSVRISFIGWLRILRGYLSDLLDSGWIIADKCSGDSPWT